MLFLITSDTWLVTGLGFGIVLALLFCLVYILRLFGWIMQKMTAPRPPKAEKPKQPEKVAETPKQNVAEVPEDEAAIAMALYLASRDVKHDAPTSMISLKGNTSAWNTKSIGLN